MGRPDESVILEIDGYKFKRARQDRGEGNIFVTSPEGINFTFKEDTFRKFLSKIKDNSKLREELGLK